MISRRFCTAWTVLIWIAFGITPVSAISSQKPDWVDGKSLSYPEDRYLSAVGYGDDRKRAEESAYGAMARIFQSEIQSRTEEWERYLQKDSGGQSAQSREFRINQLTSVTSRKILEDIQIVETWTDSRRKTTYALAVMDREHEMAILKEKISALDLDISGYHKRSAATEDSLEGVQTLHRAIQLLLQREIYNTDFRILNPKGYGIESPLGLSELKQSLQEILSEHLRIRVQIEGPYPEKIRSILVERLSKEGFSVQSGLGPPEEPEEMDLVIQGVLTLEPTEVPPWQFIRWTLRIDLTDPKRGKTVGSLVRHGKEGHLTRSQVEEKAVLKIQNELAGEMGNQIMSSIYGE